MSRHHTQLLRTIFHDPPSGNVHWRDIESFLRHVGAELEPLSGARWRVTLNRMEYVLHRPHHSNTLTSQSLQHVRTFLCGSLILLLASPCEFFDFPPIFGHLDGHALWHLAAIPVAFLWNAFFRKDAELHRGIRVKHAL